DTTSNTPSDIAPDTASETVIDTTPGAAPGTTVDTAPEQTATPQAPETPTPTGAQAPEAQTPQDMTERLARSLKVQEATTLAPAAPASPEPALPAVFVVAQPVVDPVWQDARTDLQLSRTARGLASAAAGDTAPIVAALADDPRFATVALPAVVAAAETALQPAPAPAPAPARDAQNAPTPTPAVAAPDAPTAQAKPKPASASAAGNAWVRSLPQGNWLIQYVSVKDQAQAQQWMAQHPQLKGLYAVDMVKRGNQERHVVVVQGPHTSQARAQAFATSAESPKEYWVRTARSVRGDMAKP
ncbi:MAG: SPOR domain-containing protein, partial [Burkholderiaceae bacterium]|nr:SPOR domain-containing protein [Burkholderiaceae bacterium]